MLARLPAGTLPQSISNSSGFWPGGNVAAVGLMSKVCGIRCGEAAGMMLRLRLHLWLAHSRYPIRTVRVQILITERIVDQIAEGVDLAFRIDQKREN